MTIWNIIKENQKHLLILSIPLVLTIGTYMIVDNKTFAAIPAIISSFIVVGIVPICKHRENLWLFLVLAVSMVPVNVFLAARLGLIMVLFYETPVWTRYVFSVLVYGICFSLEEIMTGIIARIIWRKQYRFLEV